MTKLAAQTQLIGDIDIEINDLELDTTPTTNQTGHGTKISATVDENTNGFGNAMHLDSDGNWIDAHADAAATMPCQGIAMETGTGAKVILLHGIVRNDTWNWTTIGGPIYISPTTSGGFTQTRPATSGQQVQIIGYALSADVIFFNPDYTLVQIA